MAYEKVAPASWIKKLQAGGFKNSTSAKKSLGRTAWSQAMKDRVTLLVERHYEGHKLEEADIKSVVSTPVTGTSARKRKKKKPTKVQRTPVATLSINNKGVDAAAKPYADLRAIIDTVHEALDALKTANDIDPEVGVPEELELCVDMISACIKELGDRIPSDLKSVVVNIQKDCEAEKKKDPSPKAWRATTSVAPTPVSTDGVPLESNEAGQDLWVRTRPSRALGRA